jgi:mRNA-degrading endonuclease RelE of RelBE toxin-antitoxin system
MERKLIFSAEYVEFEKQLNARTQEKLTYAATLLETLPVISTRFVKKLVNTDFYELRVKVDNEVRVIIFSVDSENINNAKTIIFLNGFVKKSTKDYKKEINKATQILRRLL